MRARFLLVPALATCLTAVGLGAQSADCWNRVRAGPAHPANPCPSPFGAGLIQEVSWEAVQQKLAELDAMGAFDLSPWAADRQTLVFRGAGGAPMVGPVAMVAARWDVNYVRDDTLAAGRFVGMIHSSGAVPELGIFPGKTFVWVDRRARADDPWRSILFPLQGTQPRANILEIFGPPLLPGEAPGAFRVAAAGNHLVYVARLIRAPFPDDEPHEGAVWSTAFYGGSTFHGIGFSRYAGVETMPCFVCDRMMCCPTDAELAVFEELPY